MTRKATLFSLPTEIRELILLWLPIDKHLVSVGFASKHLFYSLLFNSPKFARRHIASDFKKSKIRCFVTYGSVLNNPRTYFPHPIKIYWCLHLPLTYQSILLHRLLQSSSDRNFSAIRRSFKQIAKCLEVDKALALLLKDPTFDPRNHSSILFHWINSEKDVNTFLLLYNDGRVDPIIENQDAFFVLGGFNSAEVVSRFIKDPRINPSKDSNEALQNACMLDFKTTISLLLQDPRVDPTRALCTALQRYQIQMFSFIFKNPYINPSPLLDPIFHTMSICICEPINFLKLILEDERAGPSLPGFQDSVRLLLDDGRVDASNMNNLALRNAVSRNNSNIVQIILENDRVDPLDGGDDCALYLAIRAQNWTCAELLLDDRRLVEQRKNYELILDAFERKRAEILMYFLKMEGFAVKNSQTFMGFVDWSPLSVCFNYLSMYEKFQAWQIQTTRMEELKVHVDSVEVMFKVLRDPLESSRAKFRAILTSWKSICELVD